MAVYAKDPNASLSSSVPIIDLIGKDDTSCAVYERPTRIGEDHGCGKRTSRRGWVGERAHRITWRKIRPHWISLRGKYAWVGKMYWTNLYPLSRAAPSDVPGGKESLIRTYQVYCPNIIHDVSWRPFTWYYMYRKNELVYLIVCPFQTVNFLGPISEDNTTW